MDLPLVCGMAVDEYKKVYPDISFDFDEDAALYIAGQELLVYRAVSNLIDNAVKYGVPNPKTVFKNFFLLLHMDTDPKVFNRYIRAVSLYAHIHHNRLVLSILDSIINQI